MSGKRKRDPSPRTGGKDLRDAERGVRDGKAGGEEREPEHGERDANAGQLIQLDEEGRDTRDDASRRRSTGRGHPPAPHPAEASAEDDDAAGDQDW